MAHQPKPRIVVTINQGLVEVHCDHIDLSHVDLITIDYDTEGAEDADLQDVGGVTAFFSVGAVTPLDASTSTDVADAYDNWGME